MTNIKLNIITPLSRPENIMRLWMSMTPNNPSTEGFDIIWWAIFDTTKPEIRDNEYSLHRYVHDLNEGSYVYAVYANGYDGESIAGKGQINYAIDKIKDGWVYVLDDDNILHQDFFVTLRPYIQAYSHIKGYTFAQQHKNGFIRHIRPEQMKETHIDQAQYLVHRDFIGDDRIPNRYTGDGAFAELLYKKDPNVWVHLPYILSYYNWLRD